MPIAKRQLLFLLLLFLAVPAFAAGGRVECAAVRSRAMGRPVRYCALLPPSYDADSKRTFPVLYWLHGLGGSEQSFVEAGGWTLVERMRDAGRIGEFVIITPDGDATFYVNSRDRRRPWENFFLREFMPAVERRYRVRPGRANRGISGISMGGYGALHLAFAHPALFGAVSSHSGALIDRVSPAILTGGGLRVLSVAFGDPFDQAHWDRNNPLRMAERVAGLHGLKIYFDCGLQDQYGFDAGAAALDKVLSARKIAHEFHLYPGGHDWQYAAQHLPASMQFHGREFGK